MPHDDFAVEPMPGLPELPPEGEQVLWQGRPDWWALTKASMNLYWVLGYFVLLAAWRFLTVVDQRPLAEALAISSPFLVLGAIVAALLMLSAWVQARATIYTITNRRVAMRIGAALTVTLNLPFTKILNAQLDLRRDGTGTIAFELPRDEVSLSYLVCWPHVRPWHFRTQPALRCIPEAEKIAALLSDAAEARINQPTVARGAAPAAAQVAAE